MLTAIIGIGPPASGKTDLLKQLAEEQSCTYISAHDIREDLYRRLRPQQFNDLVWSEVYRLVEKELSGGRNVVIDAANTRADQRKELAMHCQKFARKVIGVWFRRPLKECLKDNRKRGPVAVPEDVIIRMNQELEANPPSMWDGFDEIIKVGQK